MRTPTIYLDISVLGGYFNDAKDERVVGTVRGRQVWERVPGWIATIPRPRQSSQADQEVGAWEREGSVSCKSGILSVALLKRLCYMRFVTETLTIRLPKGLVREFRAKTMAARTNPTSVRRPLG